MDLYRYFVEGDSPQINRLLDVLEQVAGEDPGFSFTMRQVAPERGYGSRIRLETMNGHSAGILDRYANGATRLGRDGLRISLFEFERRIVFDVDQRSWFDRLAREREEFANAERGRTRSEIGGLDGVINTPLQRVLEDTPENLARAAELARLNAMRAPVTPTPLNELRTEGPEQRAAERMQAWNQQQAQRDAPPAAARPGRWATAQAWEANMDLDALIEKYRVNADGEIEE